MAFFECVTELNVTRDRRRETKQFIPFKTMNELTNKLFNQRFKLTDSVTEAAQLK